MDNNTEKDLKERETEVTEEQKSAFTKVLAIVGFFALIILMVWLAVKIVSVLPNAFGSLASIADSVYNHDRKETLTVTTEKSVINAGESFVITWEKLGAPGTYNFSYACTDGVSVEVRDETGAISPLSCDTPFAINGMSSLDVRVASEKNRFTDVRYTLAFIPEDSKKDVITKEGLATIVNATIPTTNGGAVAEETPATPAPGEVAGEATIDTPAPVAETPKPTAPTTPTYVPEVTYTTPVSDPNGKIDLIVTYKSVGTMDGSKFTPSSKLDTDKKGAIQFEIKNIGTKTATDWSYKAELPSGIEYTSPAQKALKPNERALITLGFEGISETGTEKFGVTVDAAGDVNKKNNAFTWAVTVTN